MDISSFYVAIGGVDYNKVDQMLTFEVNVDF